VSGGGVSAAPVRVALIGCGAVSRLYYAPALETLRRQGLADVVALLDPDPQAVRCVNAQFRQASLVPCISRAAMAGAELAIVASPPHHHATQAVEALRSGMAVLCEKPLATSSADARRMIEAAAGARRLLAVSLVRRFFPATRVIRDLLAGEVLGAPVAFHCFEGGRFEWPVQSLDYFSPSGSGVLADIGVHALDLLLGWFGDPASVHYEDDAIGGVEVNCRVRLKFPGGVSGEVRLSRDWARPNVYAVHCAKGRIEWPVNEADRVRVRFDGGRYDVDGHLLVPAAAGSDQTSPAPDFHRSFLDQLRNVIDAVRGRASLAVQPEEALPSLATIEYCYEHRQRMTMPWLTADERARAETLATRARS
jgi:predicted dehydrogenase